MADRPAPLLVLDEASVAYPSSDRRIGPFTLVVRPQEILAVVGASGAGKSTLLRLLAGLEPATQGAVTRNLAPTRTGFVFQSPTLAPWRDTLANVALPLELVGVARTEAHARARAALAKVGLSDQGRMMPHELSGGMAMRTSLARALVTEPELLLLDEPFAALDSANRRRLATHIHDLWLDRPRAVVFVTHDVEDAVFLAQRLIVLGPDGQVADELDLPDLVPRPAGWRAASDYRAAVERAAQALEAALVPAAA